MDASIRLMRIIWMAMVISVLIYGFITWTLTRRGEPRPPVEETIQQPTVQVLYGLGVMMFILSSVLPRMVLRGKDDGRQRGKAPGSGVPNEIRVALIIRFAMLESVAIFGLICAFMYNDGRLFFPPAMLSLVGFLMAMPSESLFQRMEEMRR